MKKMTNQREAFLREILSDIRYLRENAFTSAADQLRAEFQVLETSIIDGITGQSKDKEGLVSIKALKAGCKILQGSAEKDTSYSRRVVNITNPTTINVMLSSYTDVVSKVAAFADKSFATPDACVQEREKMEKVLDEVNNKIDATFAKKDEITIVTAINQMLPMLDQIEELFSPSKADKKNNLVWCAEEMYAALEVSAEIIDTFHELEADDEDAKAQAAIAHQQIAASKILLGKLRSIGHRVYGKCYGMAYQHINSWVDQ